MKNGFKIALTILLIAVAIPGIPVLTGLLIGIFGLTVAAPVVMIPLILTLALFAFITYLIIKSIINLVWH